MNLEEYRTVFVVSGLILCLVASAPTLSLYVPFPSGERFSELWVLGPGHMAEDYPFNVSAGESYLVYVGVGNHLGSSAYYVAYVKFRNQTGTLPNATAGTPSPLPSLYEYRVFVEDGETWEGALRFSFSGFSFFENQCLVEDFVVNDVAFNVGAVASWDEENNGFYYQVFIELWIYSVESDSFQYHNRFVSIWLNMTG
ncbi:MAG: DUF1616 domain-containing protein [Candidatus Bathyarchaeota archaeon]|nr:DUF1616 domain-containing protein [Candidatus Bathyarchaeota archaeon]MDH5595096.1 DUF1616 domain-containing protein [Candidatus Bathyarchaeota archaeon]